MLNCSAADIFQPPEVIVGIFAQNRKHYCRVNMYYILGRSALSVLPSKPPNIVLTCTTYWVDQCFRCCLLSHLKLEVFCAEIGRLMYSQVYSHPALHNQTKISIIAGQTRTSTLHRSNHKSTSRFLFLGQCPVC